MVGQSFKQLMQFFLICLLSIYSFIEYHTCVSPDASHYFLSNIYTSHGTLYPEFQSDVFEYTIQLIHNVAYVSITPEIGTNRLQTTTNHEFQDPIMHIRTNQDNINDMSLSSTMHKEIHLPDNKQSVTVYITLNHPNNAQKPTIYTLIIKQSITELNVGLKELILSDNDGNSPLIDSPNLGKDSPIYSVYVHPDATSISIIAQCFKGNVLTIQNKEIQSGSKITIPRELYHHRQLVPITCSSSSWISNTIGKTYMLLIYSDFIPSDITPPKLIVQGRGKECKFSRLNQEYICPDPKQPTYMTRLIGFTEPAIRYTIESSDHTVQVRILNDIQTLQFSYRGVGQLNVVGLAGRYNSTWPIQFRGTPQPGLMRIIGCLLGSTLAILIISLLAVLGLSSILGLGSPIGVTEIATAMTLLLQFFSFSTSLRGENLLTNMTEPIKWVTLHWPLPWTITDNNNNLGRWGDISVVENAYGCLFWSSCFFGIVILSHLIVILRSQIFNRGSTIPHRFTFGNWESRCINWLCFPVSVASATILSHPGSTQLWRLLSGIAITFIAIWCASAFSSIKNSITSHTVIWVWDTSVKDYGGIEKDSGYWSDAICNQLVTQPENRSLFKQLFPWSWVCTVADIAPIHISPETMFQREHLQNMSYDSASISTDSIDCDKDSPTAKNPKTVNVTKTIPCNRMCPGQRRIVGLLNTQWLDVLFTFEGLTTFHSEITSITQKEVVIPLIVKTSQLTGPITTGCYHFFYDGARMPFVRIADCIYRLLIGIFIGLAISSDNYTLDAITFGFVAVVSTALLIYVLGRYPYTKKNENLIVGAALLAITTTSLSFSGYALHHTQPYFIADIFLWGTCITSCLLSLYSTIVVLSVYSALLCPPMEETRLAAITLCSRFISSILNQHLSYSSNYNKRFSLNSLFFMHSFLQSLSNCNVAIADVSEQWVIRLPAYNKYGTRDLKVHCNVSNSKDHVSIYPSGEDATIQFSACEMLEVCKSLSLRPPVLSLFAPNRESRLGYKHMNVYDIHNLYADVASFLAGDKQLGNMTGDIIRNIVRHVEQCRQGNTVISMTIVLPEATAYTSEDYHGDDFSSSYSSLKTRSTKQRFGSHVYQAIQMAEK